MLGLLDFGGGDKEGAEQGIQEAGQQMYARGQATPEETAQYKGSFDIGSLLQQLLKSQMGLGQAPSGYQDYTQQYLQQGGQLGQALYGQTLQGIQDPNAMYESTLQPQLQTAEYYINRQAQSRGLLRSGIPIEQMGRAGVELAIQEANARMNFRQQQMANAQSLQQNIYGQGQQGISNLGSLYGQQQGFGLQAMGRQAGQAQQAAQYQAYPYQAQLGSYYGGQAAMQALPGQALQAAGTVAAAKMMMSCFAEDTQVETDKGIKLISQLKEGDYILTDDGFKLVNKILEYKDKNPTLKINELETTEQHPFVLNNNELKKAGDLNFGDVLYGNIPVISKQLIESNKTLYNLEVDGYKFFVGNILVHNGRQVS